jgi:hypothetical protein
MNRKIKAKSVIKRIALFGQRKNALPIDNYCSYIYFIYMIFEWDEERFILMGMSSMMNTLLVCFCERGSETDEIIRIISSRKANKKETEQYWKKRRPL